MTIRDGQRYNKLPQKRGHFMALHIQILGRWFEKGKEAKCSWLYSSLFP